MTDSDFEALQRLIATIANGAGTNAHVDNLPAELGAIYNELLPWQKEMLESIRRPIEATAPRQIRLTVVLRLVGAGDVLTQTITFARQTSADEDPRRGHVYECGACGAWILADRIDAHARSHAPGYRVTF